MSASRPLAVLFTAIGSFLMVAHCVAQPEQEQSAAETAATSDAQPPSIPVVRTAAEYLAALDKNRAEGSIHYFEVQMPDEEKDLVVAELRKQFPFESIRERLERVEQLRRLELLANLQPEREPANGAEDESVGRWTGQRPAALAELHSGAARDFITSPGFGFERMPRLSPYDLEYRRGPVVLNTQYHSASEFASEPEIALGETGSTRSGGTFQMPAADTVHTLHESGSYGFAHREQSGLIRSKDEVAGFTSHSLDAIYADQLGVHFHSRAPQAAPGENEATERWHLNRVELVGLLASDEFRVYVSEQLPAMDELKDVPTRRLDDFELATLPRLLQSDEDVSTAATPNRIRMLGALRASSHCLECHSVREGDLLGALSYELVRTPKVEVAAAAGGEE
jgi:hypothetical protein